MAAPQPVTVHDVMPRDEPESVLWFGEGRVIWEPAAHLVLAILTISHTVTTLVLLVTTSVHARVEPHCVVTVV